jgi:GNAT superfamily N-acetyltransferase
MRWSDATYPGTTRLLAAVDGVDVGLGTIGRVFVMPPEYPYLWASIIVRPESRRHGVGEALLIALSRIAVEAGKVGLQGRVSTARPESVAFLEHRGFSEYERSRMVRLDLAGLTPPTPVIPDGIGLTDLARRPDLVAGVHAVALEAFDDIPGGEEPMAAGDLAEFRARDVERPGIPQDGFQVAVDASTGEVIGYASLMFVPGSTTVAWHDMTAVRRAYRGHGVARALKDATIAWAIEHGLEALETGNDEDNAPMRAVNARLGYRPLPDELAMRGPAFLPGSESAAAGA